MQRADEVFLVERCACCGRPLSPVARFDNKCDNCTRGMSDAYQILFSIPQIDSAFMRNPAGGGRLKIDVDQATVAAVNAMLDEAVARAGVTFAAAVVIVGQAAPPAPKVRGWKEPK